MPIDPGKQNERRNLGFAAKPRGRTNPSPTAFCPNWRSGIRPVMPAKVKYAEAFEICSGNQPNETELETAVSVLQRVIRLPHPD
jgi:hypothetical protein